MLLTEPIFQQKSVYCPHLTLWGQRLNAGDKLADWVGEAQPRNSELIWILLGSNGETQKSLGMVVHGCGLSIRGRLRQEDQGQPGLQDGIGLYLSKPDQTTNQNTINNRNTSAILCVTF